MNYYSKQINEKLDIFFDKKSERHIDMKIFTEIFDFMDNSDFKEKEPEIFIAEVKRIRDIHNSFTTAYEDGKKEGQKALEIAKEMVKNNEPVEKIVKYTGLIEEEINELKELPRL